MFLDLVTLRGCNRSVHIVQCIGKCWNQTKSYRSQQSWRKGTSVKVEGSGGGVSDYFRLSEE